MRPPDEGIAETLNLLRALGGGCAFLSPDAV
jgi:hypothetical protein